MKRTPISSWISKKAQRDGALPESLLSPLKTALAALPTRALSTGEAKRLCHGQTLLFNAPLNQARRITLSDAVRSGGTPLVAMHNETILALAILLGPSLRTLRKLNSGT